MELVSAERMVVTGNLLRFHQHTPYRTNQIGNIEWIAALLIPIFQSYLDMPADMLVWSENSAFTSRKVYELQAVPFTKAGYAQLLCEEPCDDVCAYFEPFVRGACIVGYETPDFLLKVFQRLSVPYIDLMLAPWRFLPDLVFGFRASDPDAFTVLRQRRLTVAEISTYAGLVRARVARLPKGNLADNSCLFAGQVADDASLVSGGRFLDVEEFESELRDIGRQYSRIYFKAHPYASKADQQRQWQTFRRLGNAKRVEHNIYYLMCQREVAAVYALTSSVTQEAKFFGSRGECIARYPFDFSDAERFNALRFVAIHGSLLQPGFWGQLLKRKVEDQQIWVPAGALRSSLGMSWGAEVQAPVGRGQRRIWIGRWTRRFAGLAGLWR